MFDSVNNIAMRAVKVFICLYAVLTVNQHVAFESLRKRGQHGWEGGDVIRAGLQAEHVPLRNVCIMKSRTEPTKPSLTETMIIYTIYV